MDKGVRYVAAVIGLLLLTTSCQVIDDPSPAGGSSQSSPAASATPSLHSTPLPQSGRTMPWPTEAWAVGESPDRRPGESQARPKGFVPAPPGAGLQRYFDQVLTWTDCHDAQCADMIAPLDWEAPDGEAITIKLYRRPASQAESKGALFVNPGGPGGSAVQYAVRFSHEQLEGYDIVGMDSRGSGESTPVVCGSTEQIDAYFDVDSSPDDEAEKQALIQSRKDFADQCRANSGPLLDHITTIETIYDYDLARRLLGQEKLNFFGVSYGTYLGAVYAQLFPNNVGRMVLDSAVELIPDRTVLQVEGFDLSLRNFVNWCAEQPQRKCPLGDDAEEILKKITAFFTDLDANPIQVGDRVLTQSNAVRGTIFFFYAGAEVYSTLGQLLEHAIKTRDGEMLLRAADLMNNRTEGGYDSIATAFPAIRCADESDEGVEMAFERWQEANEKAPLLAPFAGPDVICSVWTTKPAPTIKFDGLGAPPILVLGNTGDSATPYQHAVQMAQVLPSAVLLTRDGPGHGVYGETACIDQPVQAYLNDGMVPAPGSVCPG